MNPGDKVLICLTPKTNPNIFHQGIYVKKYVGVDVLVWPDGRKPVIVVESQIKEISHVD